MNYYFSDCDTVALAKEYGTPLYVMSEDIIMERLNEIRYSFTEKYQDVQAYYASKAFLTREMARIIKRENMGLDVVSGGELYTAKSVDFPMEKIMFHGNNKTPEEIKTALECKIGRFVCDSIWEIQLIDRLAKEMGVKADILLRITPGVDSHTHKYILTGNIDSKFGIPIPHVNEAVKLSLESEGITLKGLHFHIGSQILENESYIMAVGIMLNLIKKIKDEVGYVAQEFNLGGGFGIKYLDDTEKRKLSYFVDPMMNSIEEFCSNNGIKRPRIFIEPGRWIVGEAGITLYTIGSIKKIPGVRTYAGIDGGFPDNPRPALYQAKYDGIIANKADSPKKERVTIAGKCCESGDILIWDLYVPELQPGDILAVKSTGAYGYSMASNYNRNPKPAVVMLSKGKPRLIVKRQTYEDLLRNEC
ncbi:MAG TPA: diaminopimelate decarboxylase [Bacillota bacterium]|nr:diaminopimelate decarboxylase [Clostridiaceae bacterium]HNT03117.1 diaminopimelate decarboxylase [Bacillota bacterium]HPA54193.1 diaminopimelate decarboxylase [Bacillota bacterium]HPX68175.1 diaminopimelate decarboxylase [Bacillota bacterium]HQA65025.1 diaminopimelate decarboxylase [Bacillota bacterium]